MTVIQGVRPYDIDNLLGGGARIVVSDDDVALPTIPTKLRDVIAVKSPYATVAPWLDMGATKEGASYSRDISTQGYDIQQASGSIIEEVDEVVRQLSVSIAEVKPDHWRILEEAKTIDTNAAIASTQNQEQIVKFGNINDLSRRRVVLIGVRSQQSGVVTESAVARRGRFVALCLYSVALAADTSEATFEKGALTDMPVTFKAFPVGGQPSGQEMGFWLTEAAGDIT